MSTNKTPNLNLHAWEPTDRFTRAEFNENFSGIDTAWGNLDGRLLAEVEARSTAVSSLQTSLDAKATTSALTTETSARKSADTALGNRLTALETAVALCGNCRIETQTYVGTGTYGASNPMTLTFSRRPAAVFIFTSYTILFIPGDGDTATGLTYFTTSNGVAGRSVTLSWNGATATFYGQSATDQANTNGKTALVLALSSMS